MNILITSVGRRSYLVTYFRDALRKASVQGEIHVSNSSPISPAFRLADKTVVTPIVYSDDYIPFLLEYCQVNNIDAVISLFDVDLPVLAKNRRKFEEINVKLVVSETQVVDICNDKWKSYQFLKGIGINTPESWLELEDVLYAIKGKKASWPLIVKPRWGIGSIGIHEVIDENELRTCYKIVQREINDTHLKYESAVSSQRVVIQEYIEGEEYGLDVINDLEGNYRTTIVKRKYGMQSGETDCAKIVEAPDIVEISKKIACRFRHYGNLDVDVIKKDSKFIVIDMNARFGGGYPFSHIAGVDLPLAIVMWLQGAEVKDDILKAENDVFAQKDISIIKY